MPEIWLDPDELKALQDVFDWEHRIGLPLDWAAYDRAKARIVNYPDGAECLRRDARRAKQSDREVRHAVAASR